MDTQWLHSVCEAYAAAKFARLGNVGRDVSYLFCGKCGIPVHAFQSPDIPQHACYKCAQFMCTQCITCKCGTPRRIVSDGDIRIGRLSEYNARAMIYTCPMCPSFFFSPADKAQHNLDHVVTDPVPQQFSVKFGDHTGKYGSIKFRKQAIRASFFPYPRHIQVGSIRQVGTEHAITISQSNPESCIVSSVFKDPTLNNTQALTCNISVAHHSTWSKSAALNAVTLPEQLFRPVCFIPNNTICVQELSRWISIVTDKFGADLKFIIYYVPHTPDTDSFCFILADFPWQTLPSIICPGCCDIHPVDSFSAHIQISHEYIRTSASRIDHITGEFYNASSSCLSFAHVCDLGLELQSFVTRNPYCVLPGNLRTALEAGLCVYGTTLYPEQARSRFIGVVCSDTHLTCAVCSEILTARAKHTSTSILHPIARHWNISFDVVISFNQVIWSGSAYQTTGSNITTIMTTHV